MANPCEGTRLPKAAKRLIVPLTGAQLDTLREDLPEVLKAIITFTAGTGMRQGEVFGLTRDKLRLLGSNPVVAVERQLLSAPAQGLSSDSSRRQQVTGPSRSPPWSSLH